MTYDLRLVGTVGGWNFDSEYVDYILDKKKDCQVNVLIDSLGGYTNTALSVSGAFRNHGNVHVTFRGMNASAATIAALGAKHVAMEQEALYLIHKCSVQVLEWAYMNEEELERHIKELEHTRQNTIKIDVAVAQAYAKRTGKTSEQLLELMSKELWLTAEEAKEYGFVDEVISAEKKAPEVVITSSLEHQFKEAGIPIPSQLKREEEGILAKIAKLFNSKNMEKNNPKQNPAVQANATAATPASEQLQTQISDLNTKVTSLEATNKTLADENAQLKSEIEKMKTKPADTTSTVVNNGATQHEESEENDFISNLNKARELSKLI